MYEPFFPDAVDEWTLCEHLLQRDGNLDALEEHYKTFIVSPLSLHESDRTDAETCRLKRTLP
jgi:hypothetical protein